MRFDIKRSIVERALEHAAKARVDDIATVVAGGLGPRWGGRDIVEALGDRVATSSLPESRTISHDVTSGDLVTVTTVIGEPVKVEARIAESDPVVLMGVCHGPGERMLLVAGATDVATTSRVGGFGSSESEYRRVVTMIHRVIPVFSIITALGQPCLGCHLSFLNHCEWEWRLSEQVACVTACQFTALLPWQGVQRLYAAPSADYELRDMTGDDPAQVMVRATEVWWVANAVIAPRTGILLISVWGSDLDPGGPVGSPANAPHQALRNTGTPLPRDGGILIAFHPLGRVFPNRTLAPAIDLFTKVLPAMREPAEIHERFERQAPADDWYLKLYRGHNAWHPLAVFHTWYGIRRDTARLAGAIWVGTDQETARILGQRAATTLGDALDLARQITGDRRGATYLRGSGRISEEPR